MLHIAFAIVACAVVMLNTLPVGANPTNRISVGPNGRQADDHSQASDISASGRWVAFSSSATNLAPGSRGEEDVYLRDLELRRPMMRPRLMSNSARPVATVRKIRTGR